MNWEDLKGGLKMSEENDEKPLTGGQYLSQDSDRASPEYKPEALLPTQLVMYYTLLIYINKMLHK
jgi:hypothetical protein